MANERDELAHLAQLLDKSVDPGEIDYLRKKFNIIKMRLEYGREMQARAEEAQQLEAEAQLVADVCVRLLRGTLSTSSRKLLGAAMKVAEGLE